MDSEIRQALEQGRIQKQLVAVYRDGLPQSADYTGFPVLVGEELMMLMREGDFALDGYVAMRLCDITQVEQVDDLPFIRKIATGENLYRQARPPKLAGSDSWRDVLGGVQSGFGGWLMVDSFDGEDSCFYMGIISRLDQNFLYIRQVGADGVRHQEETTVPLQDIVTIAFGTRYIELYRRYSAQK